MPKVCVGLLVTVLALAAPRSGVAQERVVATPAAVTVPDSVRVPAGFQHWRGLGLGAAIGGFVGVVTGTVFGGYGCSDCGSQPTRGEAAVIVGLLGAGTGGVLGFLAGLASPLYRWITPEPPRLSPIRLCRGIPAGRLL